MSPEWRSAHLLKADMLLTSFKVDSSLIIEVYFLLFASAFIEALLAMNYQVLKRQPRDGHSLCRSFIQMAGSEVDYLTFMGNIDNCIASCSYTTSAGSTPSSVKDTGSSP